MAYQDPNNKFYRTRDGAVIGGVCAGLSETFKVDVLIVRIIFLALFFGATSGFWLYIALWLLLPER